MRLAIIIIGLTAIAIGLVHIRRQEVATRHELLRTQARHATLRRQIWDRQVELGHLTTPEAIRQRAERLALDLAEGAGEDVEPGGQASRTGQ